MYLTLYTAGRYTYNSHAVTKLNLFESSVINGFYRGLCEDLTWAAYEEVLPLEKGRPAGWTSGIVHAIGFVNLLHDPNQSPHMTSAQLPDGFGISQQTMQNKLKVIRETLEEAHQLVLIS